MWRRMALSVHLVDWPGMTRITCAVPCPLGLASVFSDKRE
jgi:hypothetical protein